MGYGHLDQGPYDPASLVNYARGVRAFIVYDDERPDGVGKWSRAAARAKSAMDHDGWERSGPRKAPTKRKRNIEQLTKSYVDLVAEAISSTSTTTMTVGDICGYLKERYGSGKSEITLKGRRRRARPTLAANFQDPLHLDAHCQSHCHKFSLVPLRHVPSKPLSEVRLYAKRILSVTPCRATVFSRKCGKKNTIARPYGQFDKMTSCMTVSPKMETMDRARPPTHGLRVIPEMEKMDQAPPPLRQMNLSQYSRDGDDGPSTSAKSEPPCQMAVSKRSAFAAFDAHFEPHRPSSLSSSRSISISCPLSLAEDPEDASFLEPSAARYSIPACLDKIQ